MSNESLMPIERIERKIYDIRGERVMLDSDLAGIYGVTTKRFNEQVKRNLNRFPEDFMFQLTAEEDERLRSQIATSKKKRGGRRYLPYVFTEHGALMAANLLNSEIAVKTSVQVIRAFVKLRRFALGNTELARKVDAMEKKYDANFKIVFDAIKKLMMPPDKPKHDIGFIEKKK